MQSVWLRMREWDRNLWMVQDKGRVSNLNTRVRLAFDTLQGQFRGQFQPLLLSLRSGLSSTLSTVNIGTFRYRFLYRFLWCISMEAYD